jgi:hypothetical protein
LGVVIAFFPMSAISVEAPGSVVITTEDKPCAESDGGDVYTFNLIDDHRCADIEYSSRRYVLASPAAFVSLGLPANLQARFIFIQTTKKESIDVEITHSTQGLTIYPVRGMLVLEVPEDEYFSLVRVRGEAILQFVVTGEVA